MRGNGDGREIDPALGLLGGEGSLQRVQRAAGSEPLPPTVWDAHAEDTSGADPSYYDRPVIKEPVWIWSVPAYFYVGGAAGAAAALGAIAQIAGGESLRPLVQKCRVIAAGGSALGTGFLVLDLGRPERFLNMLRVFRPTSPLNVGSWILSATASLASVAALLRRSRGFLGDAGDAAGLGAGLTGVPMTGYTAVLVSTTANPLWQGARRSMPALFVSSAMSSAASLLEMTALNDTEAKIVNRFGMAGSLGEIVFSTVLQREISTVERVGRPLREGLAGRLWKLSQAATVASLGLSVLPGRSRAQRMLGAAAGSIGALAMRFAVWEAGKASARDPRATFHQQRAGLGAKEVTTTAAVSGADDRRATDA